MAKANDLRDNAAESIVLIKVIDPSRILKTSQGMKD